MERHFYKGDFEKFLKENADQYRMHPSEKVWKEVYKSLHPKYKWWHRLPVLLLLLATLAGSVILFTRSSSSNKKTTALATSAQKIQQSAFSFSLPTNNNNRIASDKISFGDKPAQIQNAGLSTGSNLQQLTSLSEVPEIQTTNPVYLPELISTSELSETGKFLLKDAAPAEWLQPETDELNPALSENTMTYFVFTNNTPGIRARKKHKPEWQFHFTPTIGYRKLSENKAYLRSPGAQNSSFGYTAFLDVNNVVNHKPDMGLEAGLVAKIPITNRLKAKTGLQLNVTRYGIRAYSYRAELATIALNSGYGLDSLNAISNFRNFNGYSSNWLENLYVQVAIPIGAEYILAENDKLRFGVSGSFQPTYLLGKSAYLISGDYKNYVRVPHLVRRWNMNVDMETFVSYSTGKIRWQVGPQARYQLLSSFVNEYPIKENLFNFGLKVGMSLNNK